MSTVAVLGASSKSSRYSNKVVRMLQEEGHQVIPINPGEEEILGQKVYPDLNSIQGRQIDTLTIYLSPEKLAPLMDDIVRLDPGRVIMNPGTENDYIIAGLESRGVKVVTLCTLVMLRTDQF